VGKYDVFLEKKTQLGTMDGFSPVFMPDVLFDFQKDLVTWATLKGRGALFADTGLGKSIMQLVWAENIVRRENKPVLILTPLAVGSQTVREKSSGLIAQYLRLELRGPVSILPITKNCTCSTRTILRAQCATNRQFSKTLTEFAANRLPISCAK